MTYDPTNDHETRLILCEQPLYFATSGSHALSHNYCGFPRWILAAVSLLALGLVLLSATPGVSCSSCALFPFLFP